MSDFKLDNLGPPRQQQQVVHVVCMYTSMDAEFPLYKGGQLAIFGDAAAAEVFAASERKQLYPNQVRVREMKVLP